MTDKVPPVVAEKLTSGVFNAENPPKDWCDVSLLLPHEGVRYELYAMRDAVAAMKVDTPDSEGWRLANFATWYVDVFYNAIHAHHDAEEEIYFPWINTRAKLPEKLATDHVGLMKLMDEIQGACKKMIEKKGKGCSEEVKIVQEKTGSLVETMVEHLKEEETMVPPALREHFKEEEEKELIQKILQKEGLAMCRSFLPSIMVAMNDWAKPEFKKEFLSTMPGPILHLYTKYYEPDYFTYVVPMRDAPKLEKQPALTKVGCCGIPFCFPCIL